MHNGAIAEFTLIKRKIQVLLTDEIFNVVQGNTGANRDPLANVFAYVCSVKDSEWAFALYLSKVSPPIPRSAPFRV